MRRTLRDPSPSPTATLGAYERRRCVRCGLLPPEPELFICGSCQADPATESEIRWVEEMAVDYQMQRRALTLAGWAGGWWRRWP